jgi:signal transduction histidine kinase
VLKLRAYEHRLHNIQVNTQLNPDLPEITVDRFQMQQVFLNIILNAEYFMTEAHNRGTLTITTQQLKNSVRISFADDGPGITKENLDRLFVPFFTTKEVGKGTGLGLSICYGIVTSHGGKIYARSEPGKGATFIVDLPVNQVETEGTEPGKRFERVCIDAPPAQNGPDNQPKGKRERGLKEVLNGNKESHIISS